jgi:outer membrane receptor protein involved in Fe transport
MDQANTRKYAGHDLLNLRANWALNKQWAIYGSVQNLLDARYAESASVTSGSDMFAPGLPRTAYLGAEVKW